MTNDEPKGGCSIHGSYEKCGHIDGDCPISVEQVEPQQLPTRKETEIIEQNKKQEVERVRDIINNLIYKANSAERKKLAKELDGIKLYDLPLTREEKDFAYGITKDCGFWTNNFYHSNEHSRNREDVTLEEVTAEVKIILSLLSEATPEERTELVRELNNIWTYKLPLSKEDEKKLHSPSVEFESIRRQAVDDKMPIGGWGARGSEYISKKYLEEILASKKGDDKNFFNKIGTTPEEFKKVEILTDLLGARYDQFLAEEHEARANKGEGRDKEHELSSAIYWYKKSLKGAENLDSLPEVKEFREHIIYKLPLLQREHAWCLAGELKKTPDNYDRGHVVELEKNIKESGQPMEWFQITKQDIEKWKKTLKPSGIEQLRELIKVANSTRRPKLLQKFINLISKNKN